MPVKRKLKPAQQPPHHVKRMKLVQLVNCPICNAAMHRGAINIHIDTECSGTTKSANTAAIGTKSKSHPNKQNETGKTKFIECPICSQSVLSSNINFHFDFDCKPSTKTHPIKCDEQAGPEQKHCDINMYKTNVSGLYLFEEFITEQESTRLLQEINQHHWTKNRDSGLRGQRRTQHYGPRLDKLYRVVSSNDQFTAQPPFCQEIGHRISRFWSSCKHVPIASLSNKLSMDSNKFNELLINEYHAYDQLRFHFDQRGAFEELLCGLSLVSGSTMSFQHETNLRDIIKVHLPPRSVYFMTGDSRYTYKHGFMENSIDGYRASLTFRTVRSIFGGGTIANSDASTAKQAKLNSFFGRQK